MPTTKTPTSLPPLQTEQHQQLEHQHHYHHQNNPSNKNITTTTTIRLTDTTTTSSNHSMHHLSASCQCSWSLFQKSLSVWLPSPATSENSSAHLSVNDLAPWQKKKRSLQVKHHHCCLWVSDVLPRLKTRANHCKLTLSQQLLTHLHASCVQHYKLH